MQSSRLETWNGGVYAYEDGAWVGTGKIQVHPNGIDLEVEKAIPPFQYEQVCFSRLMKDSPQYFIVGPHLTDYIFDEHPVWSRYIRPDAFLFSMNGSMRLTGLAEFRTGSLSAKYKLHGFKELMRDLRSDVGEFSNMFAEAIGSHVSLPAAWEIPADRSLTVQFMTPRPKATIYRRDVPFIIEQQVVPFRS